MYFLTCAPTEDLDQPAHPCSLIGLRWLSEEALGTWLSEEERRYKSDPRMLAKSDPRRLIYCFTGRTMSRHICSRLDSYYGHHGMNFLFSVSTRTEMREQTV